MATRNRKDGPLVLLRSMALWLVLFGVTFVQGLLILPALLFGARRFIHANGVLWARILARLSGIKIIVENEENLYNDDTVIVVSNHQSLLDVLVMYHFLKVRFAWMAKASLFRIPVFGWLMAGAGYIPVERENRKKSLDSLYAAAVRIQEGNSVIVFAEGTRGHPDGTMRPFKRGGFILAKRAAVVLQPVTINGAAGIIPPRQGSFMQRIYSGTVRVVVHPPIFPDEYQNLSPDQLSDHVRSIIEGPLARLQELSRAAR
ncbi:MAG: 1-acyl-sn-glycerol-3-phosphate acyltransferase [Spirochaetales bacterium]|nr:1-acyl-sn-glycerol-3-phosphate acyltransferase [Leptospiraceae bacterium]MCP5482032.1 1-acyl-sn-glycerol-3-phosphate acyltransferase [Spirochaetales bacterium]MCP5486513.1 1-acyl-sn-glycerol-3-phosphate acyltransferase [Spirochaetales bacterium]